MKDKAAIPRSRWLNRTVLGIGQASLFSDWSHEIVTTVMSAFLATMGVFDTKRDYITITDLGYRNIQ
jgi:hypothetical protein